MLYRIVTATSPAILSENVNLRILDGWEPLGGVCVVYAGGFSLHQAMVKKK